MMKRDFMPWSDEDAGMVWAKRPRWSFGRDISSFSGQDEVPRHAEALNYYYSWNEFHQEQYLETSDSAIATATPATTGRCRLLELPAELRELIWTHTVTAWTQSSFEVMHSSPPREVPMLEKRAIRLDKLNRPLPARITRVSRQIRNETLHLYYSQNIFECWRPLFWIHDWSLSTLVDWLVCIGPEKVGLLQELQLLYKHEDELENDVWEALVEEGFELSDCTITNKLELSEYEKCFEELGLPKHFGRKRSCRWVAASNSAS